MGTCICATCGSHFPDPCPDVCADERQWVSPGGQRSLLLSSVEGNLLWDPSGFIDDAAVDAVRSSGGLRFVTASHPHFYGAIAT